MKKIYPIIFLFLVSTNALAENSYECSYHHAVSQDLVSEKNCLVFPKGNHQDISESKAHVSAKVTASASYNEDGLGHLYSDAGIFYFTRSGLARKTLVFDNGPDYFENGLARTECRGKIGFFDKELSIVIEPEYDFAFPFKNGLSVVCMGCERKTDGEHTQVVGGKWGAIDVNGKIVESITHSNSDFEKN